MSSGVRASTSASPETVGPLREKKKKNEQVGVRGLSLLKQVLRSYYCNNFNFCGGTSFPQMTK